MKYLSSLSVRLPKAHLTAWLMLLAACAGTDAATEPSEVTRGVAEVRVLPESISVTPGYFLRLRASVLDDQGRWVSGESIEWSSSDPSVAEVDPTGSVTSHRVGYAEIRAGTRGVWGRSRVRVVTAPTPEPVASIFISSLASQLAIGQSTTFTAALRDAAGNVLTGRTVIWTSSTTSVATVSPTGTVLAHAAGSTTITATSEGATGALLLTVSATMALGTTYFQDNFDVGSLGGTGASGFGWSAANAFSGSYPVVTNGVSVSGSHSLAFPYAAAANGQDGWSEQRFSFGQTLSDVYVRYSWYVPSNFVHRSQADTDNNKFLMFWSDEAYNSSQVILGFETSARSDGSVYLMAKRQGGDTQFTYQNSAENFITSADLGHWMHIQVYVKVDDGSGNARMRVWKNGSLFLDTGNFRNPSSNGHNFLRQGYVMGWANSGFAQPTTFAIDDFVVASSPQ